MKLLSLPSLTKFAKEEHMLGYLRVFVSYYYYVLPIIAFLFLVNNIDKKPNFDPIWPLLWSEWFGLDSATTAVTIKLVFLLTSIVAVLLFKYRLTRLLVFLLIFEVHALESSFGFVNHQWYTWLYTSGIFVFLPDIWGKKETNVAGALLAIWTAQAYVMLTYTMAGINKFVRLVEQWQAGEVHGFAKEAFLYQAASWVPQLQQPAYLLVVIDAHPYLFSATYILLYFLQLFALWTMIRFSLQRLWAVLFIIFHFGTYLAMGISFPQHIILLCVLFLPTPFDFGQYSWKRIFFDLPIIGQIAEHAWTRKPKADAII